MTLSSYIIKMTIRACPDKPGGKLESAKIAVSKFLYQ